MSEFKLPTEQVELPSKGLLYSEDNPLSSGKVEIKYMTAKEEDILTNQSYIKKGIVLDKLLQSLIVDKNIKYDDLIVGDKNALLIAARILGYGSTYEFEYEGEKQTVDLSTLENKPFDESVITKGKNEFDYELPKTGTKISFKILDGRDERSIERELQGLKKINKDASPELSTRLKYIITAVNGNPDKKGVREFVDNFLLAQDSRALRNYIKLVQPDVDLTFFPDGSSYDVTIPIGLSFFWPDAG
ncbi:MAG: hypothetical protein CMD25_06780 [Flavobacteriales bacterium]|nr:hypothetical protein [Flavobacteriales bacterium]|tara:strand:+ start:1267 stop:2001 length:735 start_codon:yes stop_codon:yes gene_type:complete